jgi:DNA repair protein RadD
MLRDYQEEVLSQTRRALINCRGVCDVLPCRSGKSYIMAEMTNLAVAKGKKVLILAHRRILLDQHSKLIHNARIESVFTEVNHLGENGNPDLIIIDEAHISGCDSYAKVCDYYKDAKIVGLYRNPCPIGW